MDHPTALPVPASECRVMGDVRREIDRVDRALIALLVERLTYIERAGVIKGSRDTVRDEARIADVLAKVKTACEGQGFPFAIAEPVWRALMEGCIAHEFDVWDAVHTEPKRAAQGG